MVPLDYSGLPQRFSSHCCPLVMHYFTDICGVMDHCALLSSVGPEDLMHAAGWRGVWCARPCFCPELLNGKV